MTPKVTFIVAIYNVAPFIQQCVRSLYEQTLQDIEIILIDDCSPDDSIKLAMEVLEEYPQRKEQVRVIRHEHNRGIAFVRKEGYSASRGEYFIYIDGDDFVDVHMAEEMYQNGVDNGADMVLCDYYWCKNDRNRYGSLAPDGVFGDGDNVRQIIVDRKVPAFLWCKAVRKEVLDNSEVVWPVEDFAEDTVISIMEVLYAKRISHVAKPLYYYRYNPNSLSNETGEQKIVQHFDRSLANVRQAVKFLEDHHLSKRYERGVFVHKVRTKNRLLPLTGQRKYRKLWRNTFPEVNKVIFWGNKCNPSTYREKVWYLAINMGLYPKFKKRLLSKRFFPYNEWL